MYPNAPPTRRNTRRGPVNNPSQGDFLSNETMTTEESMCHLVISLILHFNFYFFFLTGYILWWTVNMSQLWHTYQKGKIFILNMLKLLVFRILWCMHHLTLLIAAQGWAICWFTPMIIDRDGRLILLHLW